MPLLWVLRDELNLKGTKFGCGMGVCSACTVHINGEPSRSCVTKASDVSGKSITTIEGISVDGGHPVQAAWAAIDVPKCGYCQAGQMMATRHWFWRALPSPRRLKRQSRSTWK
jgi:isoquinoline 1-oxidoreductase alpha subunit